MMSLLSWRVMVLFNIHDQDSIYTYHLILGIWDVLINQQVVDFLRVSIASTGSILESINLLMDKCLATCVDFTCVGCDNMTVVVVAILHGKTFDEWLQTLRENVEIQGKLDD